MDNREQTAPVQRENRRYTVDQLLAQMEPQYQVYKNMMRQCIAGLTEHAVQLAVQGREDDLPRLRQLCVEMAEFWVLTEDDTPKGFREMAEKCGSAFDRAVSSARDAGRAPAMSEQTRQNVLSGLELYAQEMRANDEELEDWALECDILAEDLEERWRLEPGTVEFNLKHQQTMWFLDNPDIQKAREDGSPQRSAAQSDMKMEGM
ncbi:hypothetical protein [uncultured Oscillibacter sp.]|uniref:hypothetical protein n=1 Tax=uncultured Oscillibacter sp. TaxID=876091 RepID=UPI002601FFB8|nr:hypothetical protein [uncultured Oscillibacter sp.]